MRRRVKSSPGLQWGCAGLALALLGYALVHRWLLIAALLVGIAVLVVVLLSRERPPHGQQLVILASPPLENLRDTLTALSALGLDVSEPALPGATEIDLVRTVELRLRPDPDEFTIDFQRLASASGGLLTKADQVTLQVALRDYELTAADMLPRLNAQLDPAKGRFFYADEADSRIVFLTPNQVQALSERGWRFRPGQHG